MIQFQAATSAHELEETGEQKHGSVEFTFPRGALSGSRKLIVPVALVASSDEKVVQRLAEIIAQCGMRTFLAFTVGESSRILDSQEVCLVVCDDRLIDGKYEDILNVTQRSRPTRPVIVVSRTGDWPDYLKAVSAGAFDYLAYPPIFGDLPRAIHHALAPSEKRVTAISNSNTSMGEIL